MSSSKLEMIEALDTTQMEPIEYARAVASILGKPGFKVSTQEEEDALNEGCLQPYINDPVNDDWMEEIDRRHVQSAPAMVQRRGPFPLLKKRY